MSYQRKQEQETTLFDINQYDKTNFICVKFPDSSLYYGEVAYFDSNFNIVKISSNSKPRLKITKNPQKKK